MITRKIGYLWKHETKGSEVILKGYIDMGLFGRTNIKCLTNKRKTNEKQPDFDIILVEKKKEEPK